MQYSLQRGVTIKSTVNTTALTVFVAGSVGTRYEAERFSLHKCERTETVLEWKSPSATCLRALCLCPLGLA